MREKNVPADCDDLIFADGEKIYQLCLSLECNVEELFSNYKQTKLPQVNEETLPWLVEAAKMRVEDYLEEKEFQKSVEKLEGENWDEW